MGHPQFVVVFVVVATAVVAVVVFVRRGLGGPPGAGLKSQFEFSLSGPIGAILGAPWAVLDVAQAQIPNFTIGFSQRVFG